MKNILNWPDYNVTQIHESEYDYQVYAKLKYPPSFCIHCYTSDLVGFGKRTEILMDIPRHGKRVSIHLNRKRFKCQSCNKTFYELVSRKDEKRRMTKRLIEYIARESQKRTFLSIADDIGVDEKTIRNIFQDYCEREEERLKCEMPKWLGIDEIHIIKKPRCVLTNIEHQTVIDMLDNRNKSTLLRYFTKRKDRERIEFVAMDMWCPYKDTVETMIPNATIVIDKFHVVKMANESLERAKKAIRSQLTPQQRRGLLKDRFVLLKRKHELSDAEYLRYSGWILNHPEMGEAYELKESFFGIWNSQTRDEAQQAYYAWLRLVSPKMTRYFDPLIKAMGNWHNEVFAYFDHPITNAYTESLNNLIRVMNRTGRGYSFEALRAKMLFTEGFQKVKHPLYQRDPIHDDAISLFDMAAEPQIATNYGSSISTLIKEVERD
ncbi:ISL3 family transposase [Candidatus Enterovibrio escicola]|uniref:ISL3 family transposase n=1 Tax=Candidatus Enterovibrio escicola TaxID=1927127 RepID=UPI0012383596|nr:ISL3 family transposase [Candidatus Enterovibrio escacola]